MGSNPTLGTNQFNKLQAIIVLTLDQRNGVNSVAYLVLVQITKENLVDT